jgi:hypothetical protein
MNSGAWWFGGGLALTVAAGHLIVGRILRKLRAQINRKNDTISDDPETEREWDELVCHRDMAGHWIGFFERLIFFAVTYVGGSAWGAIGVWLAFKVAAKWEAWHHMGYVPDAIHHVRPLKLALVRRRWAAEGYATFMIGTVLNLIVALCGVAVATRGAILLSFYWSGI